MNQLLLARSNAAPAAALLLALVSAAPTAAQVYQVDTDGVLLKRGAGAEPAWVRLAPAGLPAAEAAPSSADFIFPKVIAAAALRYDLSPALLDSIARQESGYRADARSPAGALGVMQLMPATARALGVDPSDPAANIMGGAAYLRTQLDRFDGHIDLALAAYNAGPGAVTRHGGVPPYAETQRYVKANLDRLAAELPAQNPAPSPGDNHE